MLVLLSNSTSIFFFALYVVDIISRLLPCGDILIPGIDYYRNAQIFSWQGIGVTGMEIYPNAITLFYKNYGAKIKVQLGSLREMPFDQHLYQGIFCHGFL